MNKGLKTVALALFGILALANVGQPSTTKAAETISVSPNSGTAGSYTSITGSYDPNLSVIWFSNDKYSSWMTPISANSTVVIVAVPESVCPGAETASCASNLSVATPTGDYSIYIKTADGLTSTTSNKVKFTVTASESSPPIGIDDPHPMGTNVLGPDGTVYRMEDSSRSPYTSAGAFLSYKFNSWSTAVPANAADLSFPITTYSPAVPDLPPVLTYFIPPRNGSLILDRGAVYIITNGQRAGFISESVFSGSQENGLNYSYANVYPGDTSFMMTLPPINSALQKHMNGSLINGNGTFYVMQNGFRVGFPSLSILDSWGYWVTDAVPANIYDLQAPASGVMQTRMPNQLNI